jgi:ABC-type transport system involved in multi-copper enzyme maturation permease subunit
MFNYIKVDLYRIFAKRSMYIFFGVLTIIYILIFFAQGKIGAERIFSEISMNILLVSLLGGGYLFHTIYNDDLSAKTLPALIGFGMKRTTIIISKIIIYIIMTILMYLGAFIIFYLTFVVLGFEMTHEMLNGLFMLLFINLLQLLAFGSITSVVVYGTQRSTMSIVVFVLLVTSFISGMFNMILGSGLVRKVFGDLREYMIEPIVTRLVANVNLETILPYLIYVLIFIALSIFAFRKKELEF